MLQGVAFEESESEMKRAAKPVAEDPEAAVDGTTTVKRSGRLSKKRKCQEVPAAVAAAANVVIGTTTAATGEPQSQKKPRRKRQRRTGGTGIAAVKTVPPKGAFLLASAVGKNRKTARRACTTAGMATGTDGSRKSKARGRPKSCNETLVAGEPLVRGRGRAANETDDGSAGRKDVVAFAAGDASGFDRDVMLLSKRFGLSRDELAAAIEHDAVSAFRERFSGSVTAAMVVVSPVVVGSWPREPGTSVDGVRYAVEPARASAGCGAATLKRLMDELTGIAPSWSLSVVAGPPMYVISHMTVDAYGAPAVDKSVVLDRQFRASVHVDGRLRYEYGRRYGTATEIVNLINELDAIGTRDAAATTPQ